MPDIQLAWSVVLLVIGTVSPLFPQPPQPPIEVVESFFAALNAESIESTEALMTDLLSDGFKTRRSDEERRSFYERLRADLGALTIEQLEMTAPGHVTVAARSDRAPVPVNFGFDLAEGKIDALSVRLGGPPPRKAAALALPDPSDEQAFADALDRNLRDLTENGRFSGVVLLAHDGRPFFHRGYGLANRERNFPITPATRFDVASISKLLTRIAIGQLAQDRKLALEDKVIRHLPDYPEPAAAEAISIRQLLDHTSGLGDIFNDRWARADRSTFVEPKDFFSLFADRPLEFEPGTRRSYSNAGFIVLGAIVETVSGLPYAEYVARNIFAPAAMSRSGFLARNGTVADIAVGYTRGGPTGGDTRTGGDVVPNLGMLPPYGCPAGSSSHTAEDLLKLDRALRSEKLLDPEWTAWVFEATARLEDTTYPLRIAGGGPGVSTGLESDGSRTAIVLANLDPPAGASLAVELFRAIQRAEPK